jgi:hypothetical protein
LSAVLQRAARWRGLVALAGAVLLAAAIGQTAVGHTILQRAGLFEERADHTSLAFVHPQSLPEQLGHRRAKVALSFVINNAGGASRDYQWSVRLVQGRATRRLAAGSVRIASGHAAEIASTADISCVPGKVQIVVSLARPYESIDAFMSCSPRKD